MAFSVVILYLKLKEKKKENKGKKDGRDAGREEEEKKERERKRTCMLGAAFLILGNNVLKEIGAIVIYLIQFK